MKTYCIFDIETVPLLDDGSKSFPPPIEWQIVAIGLLIARPNANGTLDVEALRCGTGDERKIVEAFWGYINSNRPVLVSWNGRGFDMPVLLARALVHGVSASGWFAGNKFDRYRYRFAESHLDLMDQMSDHGAAKAMKLDSVAAGCGMPGKIGGHGSEVAGMFERGEIDEIAAYCNCDVLNLYGVLLHWLVLTGEIEIEQRQRSLENLSSFLENSRKDIPGAGLFYSEWMENESLKTAPEH